MDQRVSLLKVLVLLEIVPVLLVLLLLILAGVYATRENAQDFPGYSGQPLDRICIRLAIKGQKGFGPELHTY